MVRKHSTGEITATSANQIVPLYKNVVLYSPDPLGGVEGGSGDETRMGKDKCVHCHTHTLAGDGPIMCLLTRLT